MLSKKVAAALNKQVVVEGTASQKYLAMACWADTQALELCAQFFLDQSEEERMHMMKIIQYLQEMDAEVVISGIEAPKTQFENVIQLFEAAYEHERYVSKSIYDIVEVANKEKDLQTINFLQWFLEEQREEEALFRRLIDRMKLIGLEGIGLYEIDRMIGDVQREEENA